MEIKKNWSRVLDGGLKPGQTGRLTIVRKAILTFYFFIMIASSISVGLGLESDRAGKVE
jgi:hypothetical protein